MKIFLLIKKKFLYIPSVFGWRVFKLFQHINWEEKMRKVLLVVGLLAVLIGAIACSKQEEPVAPASESAATEAESTMQDAGEAMTDAGQAMVEEGQAMVEEGQAVVEEAAAEGAAVVEETAEAVESTEVAK
ncbi:MAG: hypothetical protein R2940_08290 [Syntrophotaleaceae bacterium]